MEVSKVQLRKKGLVLEILPEFGGRISSLKIDGLEEWITQPQAPLVTRNVGDNFVRPEISGWDEMVPTTDACQSLNDGVSLPDHGEIWARKWSVTKNSEDSATSSVDLKVRTLRFVRDIQLEHFNENKYQIGISYKLMNIGDLEIPAFWSCHPMFRGEGIKSVKVSNAKPLIQTAPPAPPIPQSFLPTELPFGSSVEYWNDSDEKINSAKLFRESSDTLEFQWDPKEIPYFGIFIDNNDYCKETTISPQPAIAYKVSERNAEKVKKIPLLKSGESVSWRLSIILDYDL